MAGRLTLIAQGPTEATRKARFPADEGLEPGAMGAVAPLPFCRNARVRVGPARACVETAAGLGLSGDTDAGLADMDVGRWAGRGLADIAAEALEAWMCDPGFDGHGGESRTALRLRTARWLAGEGEGHLVAVTHAAWIRSLVIGLLGATDAAFWTLDVRPLSVTDLRHDGRRWALRGFGLPLPAAVSQRRE